MFVFMYLMDKQDDDDENFVTSGWYIIFIRNFVGKTDVEDNFVENYITW